MMSAESQFEARQSRALPLRSEQYLPDEQALRLVIDKLAEIAGYRVEVVAFDCRPYLYPSYAFNRYREPLRYVSLDWPDLDMS